ncbi:DUF6125 family protein [Chloroflexota bacterium]
MSNERVTDGLQDYSGEFNVNLKYEDFSKELLLEALRAYAQYAYRVDAFWYLTVKGRMGGEEAAACNLQSMEKAVRYEVETVRQLFNIQENDVAGLMKFQQTRPWSWILTNEYELKSPNHAVFTVVRWPILEGMEKEGEGREQFTCHEDHVKAIGLIAGCFNPGIKVEPLKLPPRNSKNEIACQWEFKLEPMA